MPRSARRMRDGVFGAVVALALVFGATQAVASPAPTVFRACDGPGNIPVSSCPADLDCSATCAAHGYPDGGVCRRNCCTCAI